MGLSTSPTRGSSPHARGARHGAGMALPWQRIIPACAGSTHHLHRHSRHGWDHPRMRGEHLGYMIEALDAKGSSPHARGAQCLGAPRAEARRIIPACAGSTARMPNRCCRLGDHPRMRGEHSMDAIWSSTHCGSSPHARGARLPRGERLAVPGIIPACAGSTACRRVRAPRRRDHPRMRGEHGEKEFEATFNAGSSPHARGAREHRCGDGLHLGIIPACAGSTRRWCARWAWRWDHPRMRGEHLLAISPTHDATGSSPHARGARCGVRVPAEHDRIIPACAGSTSTYTEECTDERDHPRMRGEHRDPKSDAALPAGSSPHARGAPIDTARSVASHRIIPACAGSTRFGLECRPARRDHPRMRGEHTPLLTRF